MVEDLNACSTLTGDKASPSAPPRAFFGCYDGHGGNSCSDYCREELHNVSQNPSRAKTHPRVAYRLSRGWRTSCATPTRTHLLQPPTHTLTSYPPSRSSLSGARTRVGSWGSMAAEVAAPLGCHSQGM